MTFVFNEAAFDRIMALRVGMAPSVLVGLTAWAEHGGWLSKTDATEHIFGSSGRGSSHASSLLETFAVRGIIECRKRGRVTYYRVPVELYEAAKKYPSWSQDNHDCEKQFIADGTRPRPRKGE